MESKCCNYKGWAVAMVIESGRYLARKGGVTLSGGSLEELHENIEDHVFYSECGFYRNERAARRARNA